MFYRATTAASYKGGDLTKRCVLQWMAACALKIPGEALLPCLPPSARLLQKLLQGGGFAANSSSSAGTGSGSGSKSKDTAAVAEEAVEILQGALGVDTVVRALQEERGRVEEKRSKRAVERARRKVLDPEGAARDKALKAHSKGQGRKKAALVHKMRRKGGTYSKQR